ncbi:MAG: hypothetical protein WKF96_16430 [Solirubrobacteraceae bacterium]
MHDTVGSGFSEMPFGTTAILTSHHYADVSRGSHWRDAVAARLAELERLAPNWDGDGGRPVSRRHGNRAFAVVERLFALGEVGLPDIVPLADGGVQLEWHLDNGIRVDFVTDDDSEPMVLIEDADGLREEPARTFPIEHLHATLSP